jgi:transcriptional regulator with XRE-family HTH domain
MDIGTATTDGAILVELGRRVGLERLGRDLTQKDLATQAGVARITVARLEAGESVKLESFIRVLRALDLLGALNRLLPEAAPSPIARLSAKDGERRRASGARRRGRAEADKAPWVWGDER